MLKRRAAFSLPALGLLAGALIARLALLPLAAGNDFLAYAKLAAHSLRGDDVYALELSHHLDTLSWSYLPLLLHMFTAIQWLAAHTGWPFRVLGKLPIVAADLAVGALLYVALRRQGRPERVALLGMGLYLFNPLVLYNGAFYGRFDAIALSFLMLALEGYRTRLFAPAYALAVSAKTFPLFLLPSLALGRDRPPFRRLALACALIPLLAVPYIATDPRGLLTIFTYKRSNLGRLSWYYILDAGHILSASQVLTVARAGTLLYPLLTLLLAFAPGSRYVNAARCLGLYLVLNQVVYEQYLLWPLPFLIVVGLQGRLGDAGRGYLALWLVVLLSTAGMLENEFTWAHPESPLHYHPVPTPWVPLNVALAVSIVVFTIVGSRESGVGSRELVGDTVRQLMSTSDVTIGQPPPRPTTPDSRLSTPDFMGALLVALALAYRLILLRTTMATVDSDQAVAGIMARHVLWGDRPIFFYGQSYNGALEAYLTAAVFRLLGQSDLTLRLAHTLFSAVLVAQLYVLARRLYGPRVALAAGLWLAVPAPMLVWWGTAAGASYIEAAVLGTGLFMVAIRRWWLREPRKYDLPALGLLAGLGVWVHPMIAYYLAALAVAAAPLAWRARARLIRAVPRQAPPVAAAFALGAAPWLDYTLRHRGAGVAVLVARAAPVALPDVLWRLLTQALPVFIGGAHLSGPAGQFARYIAAHPAPYVLSLCAILYLAARLILSPGGLAAQARAWLRGHPPADAPLAALLLTVFALYLGSRYKALSWTTRDPRYLLPIYTCVPYLLACALGESIGDRRWSIERRRIRCGQRWPRMPHVGNRLSPITYRLSTLVVALAVNVYGAAHFGELPSSTFADVAPLARTLVARGDEAVYGDYWVVWRLAFASGERLIPVVTLGLTVDHNPRGARYPAYLARAAHARRWAYILPDRDVPMFLARLRRQHRPYRRWRWGDSSTFYNHWNWGRPNLFDGPGPPPA